MTDRQLFPVYLSSAAIRILKYSEPGHGAVFALVFRPGGIKLAPRMIVLYGLNLFLSAFLLFWIQPVVGKRLLPLFGGTPAVWTACLLFFQVRRAVKR